MVVFRCIEFFRNFSTVLLLVDVSYQLWAVVSCSSIKSRAQKCVKMRFQPSICYTSFTPRWEWDQSPEMQRKTRITRSMLRFSEFICKKKWSKKQSSSLRECTRRHNKIDNMELTKLQKLLQKMNFRCYFIKYQAIRS